MGWFLDVLTAARPRAQFATPVSRSPGNGAYATLASQPPVNGPCEIKPTTASAVMPVRNGLSYLRQTLPPLLAHRGKELLEVLVIDDGSTDGSGDFARECGARVIDTTGHQGPAAARNAAAREAVGELVLFVDADVKVHPDAVARLVGAFQEPETVAVFGAYDDRPTHRGFSSQYVNLRHHYVHQQPSDDAQTFWAGLGAVRQRSFLAVGGFDAKRYPHPSIEDIDLGRRLRKAGGRIRRRPEIQATHLKRWSVAELIYTDIFRRGLPWARLMMAHPGAFTDLNVRSDERFKVVLALTFWTSGAGAVAGMSPTWLPLALLGVAALANRGLVRVLLQSGGWWLAARGILFHQLYYLYCGAVYVASAARHRLTSHG